MKNRKHGRLASGACGLLLALLGSAEAVAGGIPVIDLVHSNMTLQGWVSQYGQKYAEYGKQLQQLGTQMEQLQAQMKQYQQMLVKGKAYDPKASFREDIELRFPERALNDDVPRTCGNGPKRNPVGVQQYENCIVTVQTQNRRYNAMRQFLKGVAENDQQLADARAERAGIGESDQGALQANSNRIASIQSKMENDLQNARYTMDAYASVLQSLQADSVMLARGALNGGEEVAQTLSLKVALQAARSRER